LLFLVAAATSVPLINSVMHYRNHEQHSSALAEHEQLKYVSLARMSFQRILLRVVRISSLLMLFINFVKPSESVYSAFIVRRSRIL